MRTIKKVDDLIDTYPDFDGILFYGVPDEKYGEVWKLSYLEFDNAEWGRDLANNQNMAICYEQVSNITRQFPRINSISQVIGEDQVAQPIDIEIVVCDGDLFVH